MLDRRRLLFLQKGGLRLLELHAGQWECIVLGQVACELTYILSRLSLKQPKKPDKG